MSSSESRLRNLLHKRETIDGLFVGIYTKPCTNRRSLYMYMSIGMMEYVDKHIHISPWYSEALFGCWNKANNVQAHPFDDNLSSLNEIQSREEGHLVETNLLQITVCLVKLTDFFRYLQQRDKSQAFFLCVTGLFFWPPRVEGQSFQFFQSWTRRCSR